MRLRDVAAAVILCGLVATLAMAQPGRRPGFGGFGGGGGMQLLNNPQIIEELEIVEEQQEKLRELAEEAREEMREMFSGMRDLDPEERREAFGEMREKMQKFQGEMQEKLNKVLMPHQRERLEQIRVQMSMRFGGMQGLLGREDIREKLGITEDQVEKLREKATELNEEMQKEIAEIREKTREKLMKTLTPEQQEQLKKMIGDPFELEFNRGGQGGQRGRFQRRGNDRDDA